MSQQVNFYLTPTDLHAAEDRIRKCGDFLVLHTRSLDAKPRIVPSVDFEENGKKWLFFYLVRPTDLASIQMHKVEKQNFWAIDDLQSPVVEFSTCFFDGNKMRQGRVYFQSRYYAETGQTVTKPDSFIKWAKCILATMKKTLHCDSNRGIYIGADALTWADQKGGIFLNVHE
jgi:hypothetical protein